MHGAAPCKTSRPQLGVPSRPPRARFREASRWPYQHPWTAFTLLRRSTRQRGSTRPRSSRARLYPTPMPRAPTSCSAPTARLTPLSPYSSHRPQSAASAACGTTRRSRSASAPAARHGRPTPCPTWKQCRGTRSETSRPPSSQAQTARARRSECSLRWRSQAGHTPGVSSTDYVAVGNEILEAGDFSGPMGARAALRDKRATIGLLEVARGGLLRRGVPLSVADVACVTNVAADHLGEFGVHTVEALAEAKLVVAKALTPGGRLVLSADDAPILRRGGPAGRAPRHAWRRAVLDEPRPGQPAPCRRSSGSVGRRRRHCDSMQ